MIIMTTMKLIAPFRRIPFKPTCTVLLWSLTYLILISAANYLLLESVYIEVYTVLDLLLANFFALLLIAATQNIIINRRYKLLLIGSLISFYLVIGFALCEVLIYKFSGVGFNEQTFIHLELESLLIAFKMAPLVYLSGVCVLLLFSLLLTTLPIINRSTKTSVILLIVASIGLYMSGLGNAIGRFVTGYHHFNTNLQISGLSAEEIEPYREMGVRPVYNDITSIHAEVGGDPKNLIIIYLESFSHIFSDNPRYPGLTPYINQLKEQYGEFENYYSTAHITIQGIVSSQCGLIPKMVSGNNIGKDQIQYQQLPCLPKVLNQLDYHQEFMGGAKKHFANKALFLQSMGYDKIWGWYDYDMPKSYQTNSWGLHDGDLFDKALERIAYLNDKPQPYHLSLLTLSTHLNGNPDPRCPQYKSVNTDNEFLAGIHCTDFLLKQFISQLKSQGILNNTTVLITGDHGVFHVDLTKDLFGKNFNHNKLLGILINGLDFDKSLPMGLYDVAPLLLDSLQVKSNVNFINGLSPKDITHDRFLLRDSLMKTNKLFQNTCNKNKPIAPPIDPCENQRLLDISWAHATTFTPKHTWEKAFNPRVFIKSTQDKHDARLVINGEDQSPLFLVNGYPIDTQKRRFNHHIFALFYDKKSKKVLNRSAYKYVPQLDYNPRYLRQLLAKYKNNKEIIIFIFTEGGQSQQSIATWDQLFIDIGSQVFNFPEKPYIGVIQFNSKGMELLEWSAKNNETIEQNFKNISRINANR